MAEPEIREHSKSKSWLISSASGGFIVQLVISTIGSILIGVIVVSIGVLIAGDLTGAISGGRIFESRIFMLVNEPYFVAPIVVSFTFGFVGRHYFHPKSGAWVWVVPMAFLLFGVLSWKNGGYRPYWLDVWNNYFGSQCGGSECLYEWTLTAPFYTSVAYTIGWIIRGKLIQLGGAL